MTSSPLSDECPWCNKVIERNKKGLMPLTIHLTSHNRTALAMLIVDWMVNGMNEKPTEDKKE